MAQPNLGIYSQLQSADMSGAIRDGIKMSDAMESARLRREAELKKKKIQDAYNAGLVKKPDGSVSFDRNKTLMQLADVGGLEYLQTKQDFQNQDAKEFKTKLDTYGSKLGLMAQVGLGIHDDKSYKDGLQQLQGLGVDVSAAPTGYNPVFVDSMVKRALSAKQSYDVQNQKDRLAFDYAKLEADKKKEGKKNKYEYAEASQKLRKEYVAHPTTKRTNEVISAYDKLMASGNNNNGAGDISLVFNYMKILDPGSVVREGEFKTAQDARAWLSRMDSDGMLVPSAVREGIQRLENGSFLLPETREAFKREATGLYQAQLKAQQNIDSRFGQFASKSGFDVDDIVVRERSTHKPKNRSNKSVKSDDIDKMTDKEINLLFKEEFKDK